MKVESVEAFPIAIKAEEALRGGTFGYSFYETVLVRAVVDGIEGWGEAMTRFDPGATALLVRYLAREVVGGEFDDVRSAWESVRRVLRVRGHTRGVDVEALSGIEIALYDAGGKALNRAVCSLFAPAPARAVPVFAGSLFASRGPLGGQVEVAKGRGLKGAKVKVGFGVEEDARTLTEVRRAWEGGMLIADANGSYDAKGARKACEAFSGLDLAWFEEPVLSDDLEGYRGLKGRGVKIGAGESWFLSDFETALEQDLVAVLEPSVSRCGGVGVEMEVARRAADRGVGFSPMTGMNSAISLAASLHAAAARPSLGVEYNPFENPLQTELAVGLEEPRNGMMETPRGPGLGIEVDQRFVRAHAR